MNRPSPEAIWRMDEKELLDVLDKGVFLPKPRKIRFYAPSFMYYKTSHYCSSPTDFPTISITGEGCALKCKHCGGTVLETMYPATDPRQLFGLCAKLKADGASGCLISGGCEIDGSVPLKEFVSAIEKVKRKLSLTLFVHTSIIDSDTAKALKNAAVDAALIDVIGSDETIEEIYNLNVTVDDFECSLKALDESGIAFVPHVTVGLHYGKLKGEFAALQMIARYKPSALVVIGFMPIHGTEMEKIQPSGPVEIAKVAATARSLLPRTPLVLGCMRPKGKHRADTDVLAIKAGVDAVAFPTEEAVEFAESQGYETSFSSVCCAQIYVDMQR